MSKSVSQIKKEKRELFRTGIRKEQVRKQGFGEASKRLSCLLDQLGIWKKGLTIASYRPLPDELSVAPFYEKYQQKCRFVFPKIKEEEISFVAAHLYKEEEWEKSPWGGRQPSGDRVVSLNKIDVFFVPALAFDRRGCRLGRGKGFYDRVLSQTKGVKIGVAGACQVSNADLPEQKHDVRMDAVATERFVLFLTKKGFSAEVNQRQ